MALGGPNNYKGRDMREAHKALGLQEADFGAFAGHLVATLTELGVKGEIFDNIVSAAVVTLKDEVLNKWLAVNEIFIKYLISCFFGIIEILQNLEKY